MADAERRAPVAEGLPPRERDELWRAQMQRRLREFGVRGPWDGDPWWATAPSMSYAPSGSNASAPYLAYGSSGTLGHTADVAAHARALASASQALLALHLSREPVDDDRLVQAVQALRRAVEAFEEADGVDVP